MEHGHQRQPIFVHPDGFPDWLGGGNREICESKKVLARYAFEPKLAFEDLGEMKSGWRGRVAAAEKKRDAELRAVEEIGPLGF